MTRKIKGLDINGNDVMRVFVMQLDPEQPFTDTEHLDFNELKQGAAAFDRADGNLLNQINRYLDREGQFRSTCYVYRKQLLLAFKCQFPFDLEKFDAAFVVWAPADNDEAEFAEALARTRNIVSGWKNE